MKQTLPRRTLCQAIHLIICLLLSLPAAVGQPFCQTRSFNVSDGLPSNSISKVAQGPDGLIWVATWNGLSYFDGYGFASFRSGERHGALTSSRIVSIAPDSAGRVWLLTYDRKPYIFDPTESVFTPLDGVIAGKAGRSSRIQEIYPAGGCMWLVADGAAPTVRVRASMPVDTSSVEVYGRSKLRGGATRVVKVLPDSLGNEWVFTDAGVQLYGTKVACQGSFLDPAVAGDATYFATADGRFYSFRKGDTALSPLAPAPGAGTGRVAAFKALDGNCLIA
ncbi:MAG: hypothetical protein K2G30_05375, partial [Muribaculaceae bacterium]|nr:hypothetical protein [Muribaculaceae bacterium]